MVQSGNFIIDRFRAVRLDLRVSERTQNPARYANNLLELLTILKIIKINDLNISLLDKIKMFFYKRYIIKITMRRLINIQSALMEATATLCKEEQSCK